MRRQKDFSTLLPESTVYTNSPHIHDRPVYSPVPVFISARTNTTERDYLAKLFSDTFTLIIREKNTQILIASVRTAQEYLQ